MKSIRIAGLTAMSGLFLIVPALAAAAPAPGPVAGVGLPALVIIGGAYWLGRKFLARNK